MKINSGSQSAIADPAGAAVVVLVADRDPELLFERG